MVVEVYRWKCLTLGYKRALLGRKGISEHMFRKSGIIEAKSSGQLKDDNGQ